MGASIGVNRRRRRVRLAALLVALLTLGLVSSSPAAPRVAGDVGAVCAGAAHQIAGTRTSALQISGPGIWCIHDATLFGRLTINGGATVAILDSRLNSAISATNPGAFTMCGTTVAGSVVISGATGFVLIGDPGDDACAGNTLSGGVIITGSTAGVELAGNTIGGAAKVSGNTGNGADHGGSPEDLGTEIEGNTFSGAVTCADNAPSPTDDGQRNTGPTFLGQCAQPAVGVTEHAADDSYATLQNATLSVPAPGVLANDTSSAGHVLHATLVTGPAHGTLTLNADGSFTYTPTAGYHGPDSFTYRAADGLAGSNLATVAIRVDAPPVALDDAYKVKQNGTLTVAAPGVLGNDSDPDAGDVLHPVLVTNVAHGSLTLNTDGSFTYVPSAGFHGTDSFTYRANDGFANSNVATVTIVVNTPPVAVNNSYAVVQNKVLTVAAPGVLGNDSDADGNPIHAVLVAGPAHGSLMLNADGSFTYTPTAGFHGSDSFTYTANDGLDASNVATVAIKVDAPPVAVNDSYTVLQGGSLTVAAPGVIGNDTDAEGDALHAALVAGPAHGSLILNANGSFTYTPAAGYHGPDSFTYKVNDGLADSNVATVGVKVDAPPVAVGDSYSVVKNAALIVAAPGVLVNDSDPDGDAIHAVLGSGPAHGSLTLHADGSFTYTPTVGFSGMDSFTYLANDGFASSAPATVGIKVDAPPVAVNDAYTVVQGGVLTVAASGVLGNDTDAEGDPLTATMVAGPSHGALTLNPNGSFTYTPAAGFHGSDSFTYKANDGLIDSNVATVAIKVDAPPVAVNDSYTVLQGGSLTVAASGVLGNDTDAESDALHAALVAGPAHGSLILNANGSFTYSPAGAYHGPDSFTYKANDGFADSNVATVTIKVDAPPVAVNDSYSVAQNGTLTVGAATGILANDTDADSDALTAALVSGVSHGNLTLHADGSFTYTPTPGYFGPDSFTYKASDGFAVSNSATVSISVNGQPTVIDHSYTVLQSGLLTVTAANGVLAGASDPGGHPLTASVLTNPSHGTLTNWNAADGSFTYTPTAGYNGPDSFTFKANDGTLDSAPGTVSIKVDAPPVAVNDSYTVLQGGSLTVGAPGVLGNDTDADLDTLTAALVANVSHGTLTLNADGSFTYTPTGAYHGPDSFTYKANDGFADSNAATVSIKVDAAPVAVNDSYGVAAGSTLNVLVGTGVLANDTDADGDALTAQLVTNVANGSLTLNANGSFTYAPNAGFHGTDTFTYKANDGFADSNVATVSIKVDAAPVAVDDSYTVPEATALIVSAGSGVLHNDTDADGDALTAHLVANVGHGTLTLNADGSFTYSPANGFFGTDTFTYKANDGTLDSNVATVTITVTHVNQPPVNTVPGTQTVTENSSLTFKPANSNAISVADSDAMAADVEQVALSVSNGTVTLAAGSSVSVTGGADASAAVTFQGTLAELNAALNGLKYTPSPGFHGSDSLTMTSSDLGHNGTGGAQTATSTVGLMVVPAPPIVVPQTFSGAVGNTKFEVGTAAGTGPEVFRSGNVLTGDSDPNGPPPGTLSVTAGSITTAHGGTVTMAADGTFVYIPAVGFAGPTDTFSYTVNASEGSSATATATINFAGGRIWYVNVNAATNGDGRSGTPFNTLAAFGAGRPDASGDTIFLYGSATQYAGGIALQGSEALRSQSVGLFSGADTLVAATGSNPTITNAAGNGITLGNGDVIQGINVSGASGSAVAGTGVVGGFIDTVSPSGSLSGASGLSLTGGGTGNISVGASITGTTGASVTVSGRTSGTVALSGAISGPVSLTTNTGATINFTGTITISSGASAGFTATGGGVVSATASGSTVTSTTGKALDVENTTITGLTFQSISANGAPDGIVLNNTGFTAGLTVTGNGGTCTATDQSGCSGGQIRNTAGADDASATPVGTGIVLNSTDTPSFTRMWIHDNSNYAIRGTSVLGFTLANSVINGVNGTSLTNDDSSIRFDNLEGAGSISNTAISGGYEDNFVLINSTASISLNPLTFDTDTIGDNSAAGGRRGVSLQSTASASALRATIMNSTFTGAAADLLNFDHGGSGAGALTLSNNHFSNNHPGIVTGGGGVTLSNEGASGATNFTITNNTFRDAQGDAILVFKNVGASTQTGTFSGNTVGVAATGNSGSFAGSDLKLQSVGQGTDTWTVTGNTLHQFNNFGVLVEAGGGASAMTGNVNTTITGNTIDTPGTAAGFSTDGIHLNIGTVPADTFADCAIIGGAGGLANSVAGTGTNGAADIRVRQRQSTTVRLPGYGGAPGDAAAVEAFVLANNPAGSPSVLASINFPTAGGGFTGGAPATCP